MTLRVLSRWKEERKVRKRKKVKKKKKRKKEKEMKAFRKTIPGGKKSKSTAIMKAGMKGRKKGATINENVSKTLNDKMKRLQMLLCTGILPLFFVRQRAIHGHISAHRYVPII